MKEVKYESKAPLQHPKAADYVPTYLYEGIADPSGRPDVDIRNDFFGTRRKVRIGVLGAGIMGLQFLHSAEKLKDVDIVVYEMNDDVGGVWLTSKYPGCRCDIASIVYQFSWRTNIWSEMYAPAAENLGYIKAVAKENDFYRFIKFRHQILSASWTDRESKWTLRVKDLKSDDVFEDKVDFFLEFNGPVSNPRLTPLAGIDKFKGEVVHPAHWKDDTTVKNKRVTLIGYGCSGVQIGPNIVNDVSKLYTWFRNKTYVLPPPNQAFSAEGGNNFKYSKEQKEMLKDPDVYLAYRKAVENTFNARYSYLINGGKIANDVQAMVVTHMKEKLASKPDLFDAIIPQDFGIGCRRQTFAYGYLETLVHPKTTVFLKPPQHFTERGILDADGTEHEIDMVIAATGYDQSHMPRFPHTVNGHNPAESEWKDLLSPPSYMACMLKSMPNYFNPASAFGPLPQGNFYQSAEAFAEYIVQVVEKMQLERILSFVPKDVAVEQFVRHANAWMKRTALTGPCVAWYKGNDGTSRPPSLWPGERSQFLKIMSTPRFEDFELRYENEDDRFGFFGNGWDLEAHGVEGGDLSWYMGRPGKEVEREVIERLRGIDGSVKREGGVEILVKGVGE
ncbi:cyclohexanone monooxygenase [Lecanosticta acicola]|uniref:Cyclohexanone monooxygenase n=1 Tax=Lecanosticta acicola TaxID=111012 RepID=A0AAI8YW88_9PEZI|nr:cyclohexanone monooxygenase [Lecanosticta acicola]